MILKTTYELISLSSGCLRDSWRHLPKEMLSRLRGSTGNKLSSPRLITRHHQRPAALSVLILIFTRPQFIFKPKEAPLSSRSEFLSTSIRRPTNEFNFFFSKFSFVSFTKDSIWNRAVRIASLAPDFWGKNEGNVSLGWWLNADVAAVASEDFSYFFVWRRRRKKKKRKNSGDDIRRNPLLKGIRCCCPFFSCCLCDKLSWLGLVHWRKVWN